MTGPDRIRDFIDEAPNIMEDASSIRSLIDSEDQNKVIDAINICRKNIKEGDDSARKYAYFVLGQIGDEVALDDLNRVVASEQKRGLVDAANSAIDAIRKAPRNAGFSETNRRTILENS